MSSTLPMLAIVTRNKFLGWTAVIFAGQSWLAETPAQKAKSPTSAYFSVLMAFMSLLVVSLGSGTMYQAIQLTKQSYVPLFMPPQPNRADSSTDAPPPAPQ
jgi:cytochrome c-type biogenesis protein CcmH/NrfG